MKRIKIFLLGMIEFRHNVTSHFEGSELNTYDKGRDLAHLITLRFFDTN